MIHRKSGGRRLPKSDVIGSKKFVIFNNKIRLFCFHYFFEFKKINNKLKQMNSIVQSGSKIA
jgi:hypothetical protein